MMDSLGNLLSHNPFKKAIMRGVESAEIVEKANEVLTQVFGEAINEHAHAAYTKHNRIFIACLSSTVAQEIRLHEKRILELILQQIPSARIAGISFIV